MDLLQGEYDIKLKWTRFETIAQTIEYVQEWKNLLTKFYIKWIEFKILVKSTKPQFFISVQFLY